MRHHVHTRCFSLDWCGLSQPSVAQTNLLSSSSERSTTRHVEQSQPSLTTQTHTCGERSVGEVEKSVADQQESQKLRMRLEKVFDVPKKSDLTMQVCTHRVSQCGVICEE